MPVIMQGDRTPAVPETAEGMAMLFNAASVIQRRFVRLYDDRITKPIIDGFYAHNMEFHPDDSIKGEYATVPLGSTALLEKERQSQAVLGALQLAASPIVEPHVDTHGLIEDAFTVLRLGHRVKDRKQSEEEVERRRQAAAQAAQKEGGAKGPDQATLQIKQQELAERAEKRKADVQMHQERIAVDLEKLAATTGVSREKLMAQLGIAKMKEDAANQRFNAEVAVKQRQGEGI
jgi:hypothetical protein